MASMSTVPSMTSEPNPVAASTPITGVPALTTPFKPPPSCVATDAFYAVQSDNDQEFLVRGPRGFQSECFPESYTALPSSFYSPGFCPGGYTPACSNVRSIDTLTETHYTCCPQLPSFSFACGPSANFQHPWESSLGCMSTFTQPITVPTVKSVSSKQTFTTNTQVTITPPPAGNGVDGGGGRVGTVYAFSVHVARQSTQDSMASDGKGANNGSQAKSQHDRSIAIGVGVGVGTTVLLLIVGAYLIWRRRKNRLSQANSKESTGYGVSASATDGGDIEAEISDVLIEMPGTTMEGTKPVIPSEPVELPSDHQIHPESAGPNSSALSSSSMPQSGTQAARQTPVVEVMGDVPWRGPSMER